MKKDVIINVNSIQKVDDHKDTCDISVLGTLEFVENGYIIKYTEYDGEMKGCNTTVTVENGNTVSVIRDGGYTTELMLENGTRHSSLYSTPYGEFTIGLYTKKVLSEMTESGGTLETVYTIDFSTGADAENTMKITVSEGKKQDV